MTARDQLGIGDSLYFSQLGEDVVRAKIESKHWTGQTEVKARQWLAQKDAARAADKEFSEAGRATKALLLSERATAAAERAAEASERAAGAAERSARWTRAAAWASAFAAIAAAVSAAWPWIATVWQLPGSPK